MSRRDDFRDIANSVPFDNSTNGFTATDAQAAIEEVRNLVQTSASPGFSFGKTGVCSGGTYLQCETVPSNVSGRWVYIANAKVTNVYIANELSTTFTVEVTYHDGNGINEVILGLATVTASKGASVPVNWVVPTNKQIAIRIYSGTADSPKNIVVGLQLTGST